MATGKRYYWMKLKESFMTSDTIDYFMSQPDGANYVVLYQMLCLKTINTDGRLSRQIGEVIIPYDVEKIRRDCKFFTSDTIRVALNLYKSFGLIYEDIDGTLVLANHNELVGSETDYAAKNRNQRSNKPLPPAYMSEEERHTNGHNVSENVSDDVSENVSTDIRDKISDIREPDIRYSEKEIRGNLSDSDESDCRASAQRIIDAWNKLPIESKVQRMSADSTRAKCLRARIREHGEEAVLTAVSMIYGSDFLLGKKADFQITFDWFVKPNNFVKVLGGNYNNRSGSVASDPLRESYAMMSDWAERSEA